MAQTNISLEKVIKGLEWVAVLFSNYERHAMGDEEMQSLNDALTLLKEQKPIRPLIANDMYFCGSCKYAIPRTTNYCPKCGKKVEWGD